MLPPLHKLGPRAAARAHAGDEEQPTSMDAEMLDLNRLKLGPPGMDGDAVHKLVSDVIAKTIKEVPDAPAMLCLQDENSASLVAARTTLSMMKDDVGNNKGVLNQFDDMQDHARYKAALAAGKLPAKISAFLKTEARDKILEPIKERLRTISSSVARDLGASIWEGNEKDPLNNMGFVTTYTDRYDEVKHYKFHQDIMETGHKRFLPNSADWIMLTMVYYLLDQAGEEATRPRVGQGSTLYNLNDVAKADADTQVAYCPLQNGSITIFDGSRWHAVGPNYGIGRGAVIHKVVLYKPGAPQRAWSRGQWWQRAQQSMLRLACDPANSFSTTQHGTTDLCVALKPPNDAEVAPRPKRKLLQSTRTQYTRRLKTGD